MEHRTWMCDEVNSKQQTLQAMETEGAKEVQLHFFLTSAQGGGECSYSRSGRFNPVKTPPVPNEWKAGWDPQIVLTLSTGRFLVPAGTQSLAGYVLAM
jgi:hypothetical protein